MKISGLLPVIVIAVMGYSVCNSIILNPADVIADVGDTVISSKRSYRGPFGVDSQKILTDHPADPKYKIGIVSSINLEKNDDGTWYVYYCRLFDSLAYSLTFTSPYPQQYDLNVGDFIGFSANIIKDNADFFYRNGRMLENISSQTAQCKIDNISGLSTPSYGVPLFAREKDWVIVTGVIMAVEIERNADPEPDNPDDFQIHAAVMKCADGKLYVVDFERPISELLNIKLPNLPSHDAFGEGDVVTVIQTSSVENLSFDAYYKKISKKEGGTKTYVNPNQQAVKDAGSDAESAANKWFWFGGTCVGTTFLSCVACGLPSMGIAYFYEPAPPTSRLIGKSPEYVEIYQKAYKEKVRSHQVSRATWGCIVGSIGFLYLVGRGTSL